jgi:DNA-binding Lrp family transcriptional regulator
MIDIKIKGIKKTHQELIIEILSLDFPLRIKDIHNRLKEKYNLKLSFQAVRKALNTLVVQGKLILERNEYQLKKEWVKDNKRLSDKIVENYFKAERKEKPPQVNKISEDMQVFHFENALQTDKFLGELLFDIGNIPGEKILCIQALHYWYFLGHLGTESDFIQEMIKKNTKLHYLAFGGNSLLDRLSKNFYRQHGIKFEIIKEPLEKYTELCVIQNFVIRVEYQKEFIHKLEKIFYETEDIKKFNFLEFGKLIKSNYPVILTLFKDATISRSIKDNTLKYF